MSEKTEIIDRKRKEVATLLHKEALLRAAALQRDAFRGFQSALDRGPDQLSVIAEIKKSSPWTGTIDPDYDPVKQFRMYREGKASCVSVATDTDYFQGSVSHLALVSAESNDPPLLRRDFIIHPVQIYQSIVSGADAITLVADLLAKKELENLYKLSRDLQLDVLVEIQNIKELDRALDLGADIISINNRKGVSGKIDFSITENIIEEIPDNIIVVGTGGIQNAQDAQRLLNMGCNSILVGEALMRSSIPQEQLSEFLDLEAAPIEEDAED